MERFAISATPVCPQIALETETVRISVLTSRLIRVEQGEFTDLATQTVWNRELDKVPYTVKQDGNGCTVRTEAAEFMIDLRRGEVRFVVLADGTKVTDFHKGNLLGTARTLDMVNGAVKLEKGILSRSGASVMDDSRSLCLDETGKILPRKHCKDRYYFAYGHDYLTQLQDFFRLTGPVPLIPRYALGNWWSRYKAYTQEEYRELMQTFIARKIPVTVATIDMDWHWTDVIQRFGPEAELDKPKCIQEILYNLFLKGWTGYTWNTELFPDHVELLRWLHDNGFHVPLNVHPSQGIRFFEACYEAVCKKMGVDPATRKYVPFDIGDPNFVETYFDDVHHPLEAEGVDFWWIDWQQGTGTGIPGLDPLWALNHYHTLDSGRGEKRPLILSRYAGLGSHRYPLGFSGDSITTWKSLDFQPYFTNNAANAGYTWWSHDIGGHMKGQQDDELYLRWLQYGVFSPINRLHSSNSDFMGKEPWKRNWAVSEISQRFLRLRHKMIPYLYTANYETHTKGVPLCMPMYYRYDCDDAYHARNQYIFGGQLLVCPITEPADRRMNLAKAKVWLPDGIWTDIFTGDRYQGGRWVTMYRDLDSIPVLAQEGAIVPMYGQDETNDLSLNQPLELNLWPGNGAYSLYEDDGETNAYQQGAWAITQIDMEQEGDSTLQVTITPPGDSGGLLPDARRVALRFHGIAAAKVSVDDVPAALDGLEVQVGKEPVSIRLSDIVKQQGISREERISAILTRVQGGNVRKSRRFSRGKFPMFVRDALAELDAMV